MPSSCCFIFLPNTLIAETYLSVVCDETHQLLIPLEHRALDQLKALQTHHRTYLIFPSQLATLYQLSAPKLSSHKLKTAIHFFLETRVAEPLDTLQIVSQYQNETKTHQIAVVQKNLLTQVFNYFKQHAVVFDAIFVDASALKRNEGVFLDDETLLVHTPHFHGYIPKTFASIYAACINEAVCYSTHPPSSVWSNTTSTHLIEIPAAVWLLKQFSPNTGLNLCQNEFASTHRTRIKPPYPLWAAALAALFLLTFIFSQGLQLYRLKQMNAFLQKEITVYYLRLFSHAAPVSNVKFQVTQALKNIHHLSHLWPLMDALGMTMNQYSFQVTSLKFQNNALTLVITLSDFKQLEAILSRLKSLSIQVHQTQTTQQGKTIQSTLELK